MSGPPARHRRQPPVTTSRSGTQSGGVAVLVAVAAAVGGWWWWRKRQADEASGQRPQQRSRAKAAAGGAGGVRSAFRFPGTGRSSGHQQQPPSRGVVLPQLPGSSHASRPQAQGSTAGAGGNAKKNKERRRAKKQDKHARKVASAALDAAGVSSSKKGDEGPTVTRWVDLSKTDEVYDRVREWQETGKKRYS